MENKKPAAAQPAAGANAPQPSKATASVAEKAQAAKPAAAAEQAKAQAAKPAATAAPEQAKAQPPVAPKTPSIEELIHERSEQVLRQAELVGNREILLSTKNQLQSIAKELESDLENDAFDTSAVKITVDAGDGYRNGEKLRITNPELIVKFAGFLSAEIEKKVAAIEKLLLA